MDNNRALDDTKVEKVNGGATAGKRVCELCGGRGEFESYNIKIKFTDGIENLGRKRICLNCRDTYLKDYIRQTYPGRALKDIYMEGPLMN